MNYRSAARSERKPAVKIKTNAVPIAAVAVLLTALLLAASPEPTYGSAQTPTAPTELSPPADPNSPEGQCQIDALAKPSHLKGAYVAHKKYDYRFKIGFGLKALDKECNDYGKRSVVVLAEESINKGRDYYNFGDTKVNLSSNKREKVSKVIRAARMCWADPGFPANDKKHHTLVRTTAVETWTPKHGKPVSREIDTKPKYICD